MSYVEDVTLVFSRRQAGGESSGTSGTTPPASGATAGASAEEYEAGGKVAVAGEVVGEVRFQFRQRLTPD